jgi:hypothetical protein
VRRIGLALAFFFSLSTAFAQGLPFPGPGTPASAGGGCSQATSFVSRASLTGSDVTNYTNFICSLVTNGVWAKLDVLYVLAAPNATVANLNLLSSLYTATPTNSPTFTAYSGYNGDGSTSYIDSNWNVATAPVNYTDNAASIFAWSGSNTRTDSAPIVGTEANGVYSAYINPWNASLNNVSHALNSVPTNAFAPGQANGLFTLSRASSASYVVYLNSSALGTQTAASVALPLGGDFWICGANGRGLGSNAYSNRIVTMAGWGGTLTATDVANLYSAGSTYLTAVGAPQ